MIEDYAAARDEVFNQYISNVLDNTVSIIGEPLYTVYQGVESDGKIPSNKFWARISLQTVTEEQATFRGSDLQRRYETNGLVFVQLFMAKEKPENYQLGLKLAVIIKNAFRGQQTDGCIWFRNVRIQENLPAESSWFRLNVVAEYQYNELG